MKETAARMSDYRPPEWVQIPDLGLYMDQVMTYVEQKLSPLCPSSERALTPAMVNNYVKTGLVTRPVGKKYGRDQLAQLLMICVLKQAAGIEDIRRLITPEDGDLEALYANFLTTVCHVFGTLGSESPTPEPMEWAVRGAGCRLWLNRALAPKA